MNLHTLKQKINRNTKLKRWVHYLIMNPQEVRPRRWVKWFVNPLVFRKGKGAKIQCSVLMNISPINPFSLGERSVIEYFSIIDNGVGAVHIGHDTRIGLRNTLIGPVTVGNHTILAQNVVLSGLNHIYSDIDLPIRKQGVETAPIFIGDDSWIGANSVIAAGVHIGKHVIIGGGSVVTKDIPSYSVAVGNPAKVIKHYDTEKKEWISV